MHKLLLLALLLAAAFLGPARPACAQFLWQRAVGTAGRGETAEYMVAVPGGFVTAGQSLNNPQSATVGLYLSKVDYQGDTVWTHRITFAGVHIFYPRGLVVDAAGNLVVSAITFIPPATPTAPPAVERGLLVKLTPAGDTIWTHPVRNPAGASLDALVLGNDGSYVAIGDLGTLPVLHKFSPAGALLWTQVVPYDGTRLGYLYALVAVPNGYLLFSDSLAFGVPLKYITVNESGVYQFDRSCWHGASQMYRDSQGDVLAVSGSITKLTFQGDTLWSHSYQQYGRLLGLTRIVELPNGNYLAAGERYNGPERDVGFIVVDRNGTHLRDTLLVRGGTDENVAGVALTPAGHYVVTLGTSRGPIGFQDQYLFAYRNWNRLLPTRPAAPPPALAQLVAYPNPTADALALEAADRRPLTGQWTLYDARGRVVQSGALPGLPRAPLSLAAHPAGLYLLRIRDEDHPARPAQLLRIEKI